MKALIMAGGRGTRFWPASRQGRPKQFLNVTGRRTMLQETMARLEPLFEAEDLRVVCGEDSLEEIFSQAPRLKKSQVFVEPMARNTAAAVGLGALQLKQNDANEVMTVLPADHIIQDVEEFHQVLRAAEELAADGWLVTFGIRPTYPATGFGYLKRGPSLGSFGKREAFRVARFREKPDLATASALHKSGDHDWNSGMFVWRVSSILEQIENLMPDLHQVLLQIEASPKDRELHRRLFAGLEHTSVDHGIMEKAPQVAVIPCQLGWSDVGNWGALAEILDRDDDGNVANGRYVSRESSGCILHTTPEKLVGLVGVKNLVVVETQDAILICDRDRTEEVRHLVAELKARKLDDYL